MVRKQVKTLTVLYLVPCQHFGVYFAPYQILLVMGAVFVLLAIPFLLFYDRTALSQMPAAAGICQYAPTTARTTTAPLARRNQAGGRTATPNEYEPAGKMQSAGRYAAGILHY